MLQWDNGAWVSVVTYSPDGKQIVGGTWNGSVEVNVADSESGKILRTFDGLGTRNSALAFSHDSRFLAAASGPSAPKANRPSEQKVIVWEVATGNRMRELSTPEGWLWSLAFSADDRLLIGGGSGDEGWYGYKTDNCIHIWDISSGSEIGRLRGHEKAVFSLVVTPDGRQLVSGSADGTVRVWNLPIPEVSRNVPNAVEPVVYDITVDPPWANLRVYWEKAMVTGTGRQRQIRISEFPKGGLVRVLVWCDGYQSADEGLGASSSDRRQSWSLKKLAEVETRKPVKQSKPKSLAERLRGTKWINTNGVTFEWDETDTFRHNGKPMKCEVLDDTRIRIDFGKNHIDTFVFDKGLKRFDQFSTQQPNRKPLFTGERVR